MADRCPVTGSFSGERCELEANHNSPHRRELEDGVMTWEPAYVGDLRRALEDAQREALALRQEDLDAAVRALLARIEEAASDRKLPPMLNRGPLFPTHPLYGVWRAMEDVREALASKEKAS